MGRGGGVNGSDEAEVEEGKWGCWDGNGSSDDGRAGLGRRRDQRRNYPEVRARTQQAGVKDVGATRDGVGKKKTRRPFRSFAVDSLVHGGEACARLHCMRIGVWEEDPLTFVR
jgi:hypothetical protein